MSTSRLIIVRHGERADLVASDPWQEHRQPRPRDPPLTAHGLHQAVAAAQFLQECKFAIRVVYCSPLLRCLQTASHIAAALHCPVKVVVPLAKCCSYFRKCARRRIAPHYAREEEATAIVRAINPQVNVIGYEPDDGTSCRQTLERLAKLSLQQSQSDNHPTTLIVGHSEAQREMITLSGHGRTSLPYCGSAIFDLAHDSSQVTWSLSAKPERVFK